MKHEMPNLPYSSDALAPGMSRETLDYHYGKHLATYVDNLNKLIVGTEFEQMPLEDIISKADGGIFNNAAQVWNHTFFFQTLSPVAVPVPERVKAVLASNFGSFDNFKAEFTKTAVTLFGSGWAWLSSDAEGKLHISAEQNAGNPLRKGLKPLLTVDVWEHAYYIDYRNRRADFVAAWWDMVDWNKIEL